jgi:hypothetical protein
MNNIRRLMVVGALATGTLGMATSPAYASSANSYAPDGAGKTMYNPSTNHYQIYDTKGDHRAVGVLFYRPEEGGDPLGFQSCHEGNGNNCPGDLPSSITGQVCMVTGVGLGPDVKNYSWGKQACFDA